MFSIKDELQSFKAKSINTYEIPINDLNDILNMVQNKMDNIDKASKRNSISMEIINEEIKEKNQKISELTNKLRNKNTEEKMCINKIVNILDQVDNIYAFAIKSNNNELANNVYSVINNIKNDLLKIEFEEIPAIGTIFNPELHQCVGTMNNNEKRKYEIIDVVKKGYKFKKRVIRESYVIAVK